MRRTTSAIVIAILPWIASALSQAQRGVATPLVPNGTTSAPDTMTAEFDVGGVRVLLRRNTANDVVAANLYLLGGTQQLTSETQGIEGLLLAASERGTLHYPGDANRQRLARLGSTVDIDATQDWTLYGFHAIRATFDSTWALFADRVIAPTLDSAAVELVRQQLLGGVREHRTQPDAGLEWLADSILFARQPYGLAPEGTEASLSRISVSTLRAYHATQFVTSRMLLVIVGNVDREQVRRDVQATLSRLPHGAYQWKPPAAVTSHPHGIHVEAAALPTNYLLGHYVGPAAGTRDYDALRLASAVLSGRFFSEIRSKRNLTYAVDAPFLDRAFAVGGVYVTTVAPDTVLRIMRDQLDQLQRSAIEPEGLARLVQQFITDYYLRNETNADQATLLARAELYDGDFRAAGRFVNQLRMVTPDDIRRVAKLYMQDFQFVYIGDPAKITPALAEHF